MRFLVIICPFLLFGCALHVEPSATSRKVRTAKSISWPKQTSSNFRSQPFSRLGTSPKFIATRQGEIATYGPRADGTESFVFTSKREENFKSGIYQFQNCLLPESKFAGPSPFTVEHNHLSEGDFKWDYLAYDYRSTFFELFPALTPEPKGLLFYHTSIMLLSTAEKKIINNFRKLGWNTVVALPPDSLYRTKFPAISSYAGTLQKATDLVAEDMDQHYLSQAYSTEAALDYLAKNRPSWLTKKRVLMGTSAGTFAMPIEVLRNPDWDALVFVSGGTNLLSLYEAGAAGAFKGTLKWIRDARRRPPIHVTRIFSDDEYHEIHKKAAAQTKYHSGNIAPYIQHYPILMIAGTTDKIVPKEQALNLYQALGKPERWTAPVGHLLIAVKLVLEIDRIDQWIDRETR